MATQAKKSSKKQQSPVKKEYRARCRERAAAKRKMNNAVQLAAAKRNKEAGVKPWDIVCKKRKESLKRVHARQLWARQNPIKLIP